MREFKDSENNRWKIDLHFGAVRHVKSASNGRVDLLDPSSKVKDGDSDGQTLIEWLDDWNNLWEVLWYLVEEEAKTKSISAEQFGKVMAADCLVEAKVTFWQEWKDFFQKLQQPDKLLVLEKKTQYETAAMEMVKKKMSDPKMAQMDALVFAAMEKSANDTFTNSLASLDEILGPTPTGNSG